MSIIYVVNLKNIPHKRGGSPQDPQATPLVSLCGLDLLKHLFVIEGKQRTEKLHSE